MARERQKNQGRLVSVSVPGEACDGDGWWVGDGRARAAPVPLSIVCVWAIAEMTKVATHPPPLLPVPMREQIVGEYDLQNAGMGQDVECVFSSFSVIYNIHGLLLGVAFTPSYIVCRTEAMRGQSKLDRRGLIGSRCLEKGNHQDDRINYKWLNKLRVRR
jgi:hypothetical protein